MKRTPKIIFFDIDDTLWIKDEQRIPDSTRTALGRLKERGIAAAIATGRPPCLIPDPIRALMADAAIDILVAINGQYVERSGQVLAEFPLSRSELDGTTDHLRRLGIAYAYESARKISVPADSREMQAALGSLSIPYQTGETDPDIPVHQILGFYDESRAEAVESGLPDSLRTTRWHTFGVDILPRRGSKARGIRTVLDSLGLDMDDAMAFGDGLNDMEMMQSVGCGVAVGNAHPQLKAAADHVCPPIREDGILRGLTELGVLG